MLSWAVWFKFLFNKVIANTCLFTLTSFSKQSASWRDLWIVCTVYCLAKDVFSEYTGSSSYSLDWGGGGGGKEKDPAFRYQEFKSISMKDIAFDFQISGTFARWSIWDAPVLTTQWLRPENNVPLVLPIGWRSIYSRQKI